MNLLIKTYGQRDKDKKNQQGSSQNVLPNGLCLLWMKLSINVRANTTGQITVKSDNATMTARAWNVTRIFAVSKIRIVGIENISVPT